MQAHKGSLFKLKPGHQLSPTQWFRIVSPEAEQHSVITAHIVQGELQVFTCDWLTFKKIQVGIHSLVGLKQVDLISGRGTWGISCCFLIGYHLLTGYLRCFTNETSTDKMVPPSKTARLMPRFFILPFSCD